MGQKLISFVLAFRFYFFINPPKKSYNFSAYLEPFAIDIWICFIITTLVLPLILVLFSRVVISKDDDDEEEEKLSFLDQLFQNILLIVQQGKCST